MQKLSSPRGGVTGLTFSPDGDMLAGFGGNALYCWTRSRGWEKTGLEHDGPVTGVTFHPSGRTLAYAGIARPWFTAAPAPPPARAGSESVWRRRFARAALRPFTGVHLYSLTGTDEFVPNRVQVPHAEGMTLSPESWARGLAFTPDGRALLAAQVESQGMFSRRANVFHWHFTEGRGVWRVANAVAGRAETERGAALVGDSCLALAGVWGVAACAVTGAAGLFVPDVGAASAVAVASRCELVAVLGNGRLTVWHLRTAEAVSAVSSGAWGITSLAFEPGGESLAVGDTEGTVTFLDSRTGAVASEYDFGVGPVRSLTYAPDGLTLAVAGSKGLVVVDAG